MAAGAGSERAVAGPAVVGPDRAAAGAAGDRAVARTGQGGCRAGGDRAAAGPDRVVAGRAARGERAKPAVDR
ncbi:hypothetical protein [Micromonospora endolithica]|uniref:hypothetical protein n=1 Tax=Micromonospora endolithica TaxID=230091 RepID=UPI0011BEFF77|nr:hypothetical protein [Micromonospora endolithica]